MKKRLAVVLVLALAISAVPVFAMDNEEDQSWWDKMNDFMSRPIGTQEEYEDFHMDFDDDDDFRGHMFDDDDESFDGHMGPGGMFGSFDEDNFDTSDWMSEEEAREFAEAYIAKAEGEHTLGDEAFTMPHGYSFYILDEDGDAVSMLMVDPEDGDVWLGGYGHGRGGRGRRGGCH